MRTYECEYAWLCARRLLQTQYHDTAACVSAWITSMPSTPLLCNLDVLNDMARFVRLSNACPELNTHWPVLNALATSLIVYAMHYSDRYLVTHETKTYA